MERGSGSNRYRRHAKSSSGSGLSPLFLANNASTNATTITATATADNLPAPPITVREQDQYMPIANVIRIMRRILPAHAKISDDAKETIQECVSEYISFITGEANDRCQREQRKTITAEDVIWAMGKLGFDDYVEPLSVFLTRYRETEVERTSLRLEPFVKRSSVDYGAPLGPLPPPYGQGFQMGHQGFFDAAAAAAIGGGGGYFRDGSSAGGSGNGGGGGGSSSQAALAGFDPYAQFK